jgi:hypothetical protein
MMKASHLFIPTLEKGGMGGFEFAIVSINHFPIPECEKKPQHD